jgi:2-phospho-L-lactate guanylyltransferase
MSGVDLARIVAIVPVRSLSGAKSRLGEPLDPEERGDLIMALLRRTVAAALASRSLAGIAVVSRDSDLLAQARAMGAASLLQESDGLNEGLAETREATCAETTAILVLPADLPGVSAEAIDRLAEVAAETGRIAPDRPVVVLVPDRHGTGTNALLLSPPDAIPFRFGEESRAAHAREAAAAGASYVELAGPLAFDVDTPEDLLLADGAGLDHEAGR